MSTRSKTFVIDRQEAEKYVKGFAINPAEIADKSHLNMYIHHDGYIDYMGVELAQWVKHMQDEKGFTNFRDPSRIAAHLAHDFHYNSQYLYPNNQEIDTNYTYIVWCGKEDVWISQWDDYGDECRFVGSVDKLIQKFKSDDMEYTDWNYKLNTNKKG
jgi:hypothetical protein|tara:strand:+ start:156 stop:626 length:471 start_codon:yes stop_codon:yes gene_type:complete